jgi:hypothetical protein
VTTADSRSRCPSCLEIVAERLERLNSTDHLPDYNPHFGGRTGPTAGTIFPGPDRLEQCPSFSGVVPGSGRQRPRACQDTVARAAVSLSLR